MRLLEHVLFVHSVLPVCNYILRVESPIICDLMTYLNQHEKDESEVDAKKIIV
jgi:hypothetical protein